MVAVKKCKFRSCSKKGRLLAMHVHFKIPSSFSSAALVTNSKPVMLCFNCPAKITNIVASRVHLNCVLSIVLCVDIGDPQGTFVAMPDKSYSRRCVAARCAVTARSAATTFKTSGSLYATQGNV